MALNKLIFDVAGGLTNVTGMRVERIRTVLDTVRETIDQLAKATPDDPELQRSRSAMFNMFVDTYLAAGDVNDALEAADRGPRHRPQALAAQPGQCRRRARRFRSVWSGSATCEIQAGDTDGALEAYHERLGIARTLLTSDPTNRQGKRDMSVSLNKVGDVEVRIGDQGRRA